MARLSNEKLLELLGMVTDDNSEHGLPEGVSLSQYNNFKACYNSEDDTPAYMASFCVLAMSYDDDVEETRRVLNDVQDTENTKPLTAGAIGVEAPSRAKGKRFVFTSAQNNTDVHKKFLASLLSYCKENGSELKIGQYTYNKNGFQNGVTDDDEIYYHPSLAKFFDTVKTDICKGLTWCGDLNIIPTAKNPLTGFESYTGENSSIIPHAKIALQSVATPKSEECKIMYSTGTVTMHNYIQKKAGQIAQHEHCYGALIVEIDDGGVWHARQIQTDETGIFQDLTTIYYPDGNITCDTPINALNWGDIHAEKSDETILQVCETMLGELNPASILFHDLFDMTARNHHNRKSGHFLAAMHYQGLDSVADDIEKAKIVLERLSLPDATNYIIESNHDLALEAWLNANDYDFKADPINARIYLKLQSYIYDCLADKIDYHILDFALDMSSSGCGDSDYIFLNTDDSLILAGVECGFHGHLGANGARGAPTGFRKLNRPINTGHTHTAGILGQVYTAGITGSLEQGYNKGPSSWSHSHIITYSTGFRTIVTIKGDSWKA